MIIRYIPNSNCIFTIEAMYLDPSYQGILTEDAKQQAKLHLAKTWKLLGHLNHVIPANVETETINNPNLSDDDMDVTDRFESFLRSHSSTPTATTSIPSVPSIETLLEQYDRVPYQSYKLDIMEYWTTKKHIMPELYELSKVLMAIPATQV